MLWLFLVLTVATGLAVWMAVTGARLMDVTLQHHRRDLDGLMRTVEQLRAYTGLHAR